MRVRIEMEVGDADTSEVLAMAQEMAIELNEDEEDGLSEFDIEVIEGDVSVEVLTS
jgi:hypothetical protein